MNEIITIKEHQGQQLVNARELHEFLQSKQQFADWIKNRINKYDFVQDTDYVSFHKNMKRENGGASVRTDYGLTLEMAKELSMVENNAKGREARRYFIAMEKKAKEAGQLDFSNPSTVLMLAENWVKEQNLRIAAEKKVRLLEQKTQLMDKVLDSDEKIDVGQAAKILELPFGRNTMFKELRTRGVFFKNRNEPKQEYIKRGYFVLKEKFIERNQHDSFVVIKTLVTQKGLEFLSTVFQQEFTKAKMAPLN